jgi:hypothetical protein
LLDALFDPGSMRDVIDPARPARLLTGALLAAACVLTACTDPGNTVRRDGGTGFDAGSLGDTGSSGTDAARSDGAAADAPGPDTDVDAAALSCDGAMVSLPEPGAPVGSEATVPEDCAGCPHFTSVSVATSGTTATITGTVTGASSCQWYLVSPSCGGTSGAFEPGLEFASFSVTLPLFCGTNRLQLVCENESGRAVATREIVGPSCGSRDLQVTLTWGAAASDMELHLVREGGVINDPTDDCTWFTCMGVSPDWGVAGDPADDPTKDVDNTGTYGPENIYLTRAADGSYEVMVEYWGSGTPETPEVSITLGGRTVWVGSHVLSLYDVWHVGTIAYPGAGFTPVDVVTPCAAAWQTGGSLGCGLALP